MAEPGGILFLDLARQAGWAYGLPGTKCESGSVNLSPGSTEQIAAFGGVLALVAQRIAIARPKMIVYESPFDPRHMKTTFPTARMLLGLPAVAEAVAYASGIFSIREANVNDVQYFLLNHRPKNRDAGKREIFDFVTALGYAPADDNESDAIAGWLYACSIVDSRVGERLTPLFADRA